MKATKKITSLVMAALLFASVATGCAKSTEGTSGVTSTQSKTASDSSSNSETSQTKTTIKIAALKGPTGLVC